MEDFYKALIAVFEKPENKKRYTDLGLLPIKLVDLYAGQDFNPQYFDAHLFPALFVLWAINHDTAHSAAAITIRIAYEQTRDTSSTASHRSEALKAFKMTDLTNTIIQGIQTPCTGRLILVSEALDLNDTIVDVVVMQYSCTYTGRGKFPKKPMQRGAVDKLEWPSEKIKTLL